MLLECTRTWIYALTTYFTYSKPTAGKGISAIPRQLFPSQALPWPGGDVGHAPDPFIQDLPDRDHLCRCLWCALQPQAVWPSFRHRKQLLVDADVCCQLVHCQGTRSLATAASVTPIIGTGLGIISMAFVVGALLFPRTATSELMSKSRGPPYLSSSVGT